MAEATTQEPGTTVVMVVDAQAGVVRQAWQAQAVVARVARLVQRAREAGVPVLWVQHESDELVAGSPAWQWASPLQPASGEPLIAKHHNSAFEGTGIEEVLTRLNTRHIVLAGAQSNWCIRATAHAALERGYDLTLASDAHTTETMALDDGQLLEAQAIVAELNTAMAWMSYPGRRNAARPVDDIEL